MQGRKRQIGEIFEVNKGNGMIYLYQRYADGDRCIKRITPYVVENRKNRPGKPPPEKIDYQEFWVNIPDREVNHLFRI